MQSITLFYFEIVPTKVKKVISNTAIPHHLQLINNKTLKTIEMYKTIVRL